jgi:hypothetical protein
MKQDLTSFPTGNVKAKILIDKYFEGQTTLDEEEYLRQYFQSDGVLEELEMYRPIFQYFSVEREQKDNSPVVVPLAGNRSKIKKSLQWTSLVAACLLLLFGLRFFTNIQKTEGEISMAYIDGKKYTNINLVGAEMLNALENLTDESDGIYPSLIEALDLFIDK